MKTHFTISLVLFAAFAANAQVSIGGKQSVEGTATLLDFNSTNNNTNGIILPAVTGAPILTTANNGTFVFDTSDQKVKMYEKNAWKALSDEGDLTDLKINTSDEVVTADQGAIIGSPTSNAKGVLVLESENKAMILPRISNPHQTVEGPYPGMICYDTVSKSLAVYDGKVWSYWK